MLILGTRCNINKALTYALQAIFGVNIASAGKICAAIGVHPYVKLKDLPRRRLDKLIAVCRNTVPTSLFRFKQNNVKELINIKHYKGVRHMFGLPAHGQRTRTNASTVKKLKFIKPASTKVHLQKRRRV